MTTTARRQILLLACSEAFYLAVPPPPPRVKNTVYCTLVRPELEYASSVWNPHMKCNVDKIEMVQRRAARFVCHDYSRYSHLSTLINALSSIGQMDRSILFIYANRFKGIETGF